MLDYMKAYYCVDHSKLENSSRDGNIRSPYLFSWKTFMQIKKQLLAPYMEQQTVSKLGKEYTKAEYCHFAYLTYMQSTSCEMLG